MAGWDRTVAHSDSPSPTSKAAHSLSSFISFLISGFMAVPHCRMLLINGVGGVLKVRNA